MLKFGRKRRCLHTFVKTCSTPLLDVQEVHAIVEMLKIFLRVRPPLKIIPRFPFNVKIGFLCMLILHGKTRDNRHIGVFVRVSKIEVYSRKHGIIAHGVVILPGFSRVKRHSQSTLFV